MNILNSLSEIHKNRANFKKWEKRQDSDDAKRELLAQQKPSSPQELEKAQAMGKVLIDAVDIMDQHSEDIAENVETATLAPVVAAPWVGFVASGFLSTKFIVKPMFKNLETDQKTFLSTNKERIKAVSEKIRESDKYFWEEDLLSKRRMKKLKLSPEIKREAEIILADWTKIASKYKKNAIAAVAIPIVSTLGAFLAGNIYATKLQIDSSKIARFQARKKLEDPKYFVQYTPEQIEQAKKDSDAKGDKKKKTKTDRMNSGFFKGIIGLFKDRKAYQEWKKTDKDDSKKVIRELTQEEVIQAKKDQEVIQRAVKKINNNAEKYSENMEVAAAVLIGGTPVLGALVGGVVSKVLSALNVNKSIAEKMVNKHGDEEAKQAYKAYIALAEKAPGKKRAFIKFFHAMMNSDITKEVTHSKYREIYNGIKKFIPVALSSGMGRKLLYGGIGGVLTGSVGALIGLKLQKSSARAGRFVAKRELEQNPQNFVGYTQEELAGVQEPTDKKSKQSKMKEYLLFLPTVIKQYFDYKKYVKKDLVEERNLQDALMKQDVSETQLKDAKNLQRKVFNTFEKVDDKSQEYSESMEAAQEISEPFIYMGGFMLALSPLAILGFKMYKGKVNFQSVLNSAFSFLSKHSSIMKKKFFKNYLNEVAANVSKATANSHSFYGEPLKKIIGGFDWSAVLMGKNQIKVSELCDNLIKNVDNLSTVDLHELKCSLNRIPYVKEIIKEGDEVFSASIKENVVNTLKVLKESNGDITISSGLLGKLDPAKYVEQFRGVIKGMSPEEIKEAATTISKMFEDIPVVRNLDLSKIDKAYLESVSSKLKIIIDNMPKDEIKNIICTVLDEFKDNPDKLIAMLRSGNLPSVFMTSSLKKALVIAGVSWATFSIALSYGLESWFAAMQLKAGRLGVMKALDELKDPAYYANIENSEVKK